MAWARYKKFIGRAMSYTKYRATRAARASSMIFCKNSYRDQVWVSWCEKKQKKTHPILSLVCSESDISVFWPISLTDFSGTWSAQNIIMKEIRGYRPTYHDLLWETKLYLLVKYQKLWNFIHESRFSHALNVWPLLSSLPTWWSGFICRRQRIHRLKPRIYDVTDHITAYYRLLRKH